MRKRKAPQVDFSVACDCGCDMFLPLMKIHAVKSFSGDRIRVEWPSRGDNDQEFARLACPACGSVMTVDGGARITRSDRKLFGGNGLSKNARK